MIATIENGSTKFAEIFHKGDVFSIKILEETSERGRFLKGFLEKLKGEVRTVSDFEFLPPSKMACKLGRNEKETYLILSNGIPAFNVSFSNSPFEIKSKGDLS